MCLDRTEPLRSLDLMERERANRITGWPGVRGPIEAHPARPGRHIPALEEAPTGFGKQGSIGMTETLASYTYPDPDRSVLEGRAGCMGVPIDGCGIRIVDTETLEPVPDGAEGAIFVRGYFLMQGLYNHEREDSFTADGFYDTGDKGYILEGMLYFTGRHKEMIKTSGNNVAPPEVEAVLRAIRGVKDVHVLGIPDDARGEIVAALVIAGTGDKLDPGVIEEQARQKLSNYKVPRHVFIATDDELPWLATGKPDRRAIRTLLAETYPGAAPWSLSDGTPRVPKT